MTITRKKKIICYTGIHSKKNGKHSLTNFRKITKKFKSQCKSFGFGSAKCPTRKNTNGWVRFVGAEYKTPEECNSSIKKHNEFLKTKRSVTV